MHLRQFRPPQLAQMAWKNRQEIINAKLTQRDLLTIGATDERRLPGGQAGAACGP